MPKKIFLDSVPFFLAVLTVFLAGCQPIHNQAPLLDEEDTPTPKASAQAPAASKFDACSILTKADAEQILGEPVDSPTSPQMGSETFSVDSCAYQVTGGTALDRATLILTVPANGDLARAQAVFNTGKQQAQSLYNSAPVDVSGLGDAAYWVGGAGNNLSILKGDIYISLSASTQKGDSPSQALLGLAKVVLGRLP